MKTSVVIYETAKILAPGGGGGIGQTAMTLILSTAILTPMKRL